jgi:hypothetical protein
MSKQWEVYCLDKVTTKAKKVADVTSYTELKAYTKARQVAKLLGLNFHKIVRKGKC